LDRAGIFLAALFVAFPSAAVSADAVKINLLNYAGVDMPTLTRAIEAATQVFAQAGVESQFCEAFPTRINSGCPAVALRMIILPRAMRERLHLPRSEALGMAMMTADGKDGDTAYVFVDRIERIAASESAGSTQVVARLIGHVIAHEAGHLLLGAGNHRLKSIMTPLWGNDEVQAALQGVLRFCEEHVDRLHQSLRERLTDTVDGAS
jgi:hypothetical protein